MAKYTPLDFSGFSSPTAAAIAALGSPERANLRNVAEEIKGRMKMGPSYSILQEFKKLQEAQQAEIAKSKPTFLSGFFDLLSTPIYAVANAADEAIAGHQSDPNDSVGSDILQVLGGIGTGAVKGAGAGLRGSTSMLDVLPFIDINDDWQRDPTDKTRFGDVYTRLTTKMSTKDALKPENWEQAQANVLKEKEEAANAFGDGVANFFYGDVDSQQDFIRRMKLLGIAGDIALDPTTYLGWGIGRNLNKANLSEDAITAGVDAARAAPEFGKLEGLAGVPDTFRAGVESSRQLELPFISSGMPRAELVMPGRVELPNKGALNNAAAITAPKSKKKAVPAAPPAPIAPTVSATDNAVNNEDLFAQLLEEVLTEGSRVDDVLASAGIAAAKPKVKTTVAMTREQQNSVVKEITNLAATGKKGWVYEAAQILGRHPNIDFENASRFLDMAHKRGGKINPAAFSATLTARILEDANKASKPGAELIDAVRKASAEKIIKPGESGLNRTQATVANRIIANQAPRILGQRIPAGMKSEANYRKSVARGDTAVYSGPAQANIWNELTKAFAWAGSKKFEMATQTMRAINNHFESLGAIAHSAANIKGKNGLPPAVPLRLDQVAEAIGPDIMGMSPQLVTRILAGEPKAMATLTAEQQSAIKALRESSAVTAMSATKPAIQQAEAAAETIAGATASTGRKEAAFKQLPKLAAESAAANGAGDAASKFAQYYIAERLRNVNPVDELFRSTSTDTLRTLATTATQRTKLVDTYYAARVTNAIRRSDDLPSPAELGKISGPAAGVKDWLGARFNAAYGMKNMNPILRQNQAAALTTMAHNTRYLNELAKKYPPKDVDLWHEAFRAAQLDTITTGRVSELQKELSKIIENLVGGSGLADNALADATVVGRSRIAMDEINEQMRRFGLSDFQFSNKKKVKVFDGSTRDLSKGIDWLDSWQLWNVKNPYEFAHRFQQAIETTVRNKMMYDEIAARFASTKPHGIVRHAVKHPRLAGYYFNKEGAAQAEQFIKVMDELNSAAPKALQYLDHVTSKMKAALTIYFPSHHWTNLIGDTMFNWLAGVNDPRRYTQAMKVMQSQKGRYGDMTAFRQGVMTPEAELQSIARGAFGTEMLTDMGLKVNPMGNAVITTTQKGDKVTADMLYIAAMQRGILPSARVLEEVTSDVSSILDKFRPLGGKGQATAHAISEWRDHVPRMAQFIDGVSKSHQPLNKAFDASAANVRKWHPDGLDLTKFERNVMKRVFPFYSWTRKAIPLAIQTAIANPAKVMAYPHLMEAIALSNGITPAQGTIGEFPTDQMFPDWIRERGIGPVAGGPGNYMVVNPSTPVLDVMTMFGHPGQTGLDMLSPYAKVPLELMQGATLGKQVPIENELDYLARQIPGISHAGRITGYYGTSESVANSENQKLLNLLNLLTGAKATDTGIYQKSAQFDLRDYLREKKG